MRNIINKLTKITQFSWHRIIYKYLTFISTIFFIISFTGGILIDKKYIYILNSIIHIYIGIILILRFNPYSRVYNSKKDKEYDRKLAFNAGIIILLSTTMIEVIQFYIQKRLHTYLY